MYLVAAQYTEPLTASRPNNGEAVPVVNMLQVAVVLQVGDNLPGQKTTQSTDFYERAVRGAATGARDTNVVDFLHHPPNVIQLVHLGAAGGHHVRRVKHWQAVRHHVLERAPSFGALHKQHVQGCCVVQQARQRVDIRQAIHTHTILSHHLPDFLGATVILTAYVAEVVRVQHAVLRPGPLEPSFLVQAYVFTLTNPVVELV